MSDGYSKYGPERDIPRRRESVSDVGGTVAGWDVLADAIQALGVTAGQASEAFRAFTAAIGPVQVMD